MLPVPVEATIPALLPGMPDAIDKAASAQPASGASSVTP
jgi:hypothetical protein